MILLLVGLTILIVSGAMAALLSASSVWATRIGVTGVLCSGLCGFRVAFQGLFTPFSTDFQLPWAVPGGVLDLHVDPLSAFFMIPLLLLGVLGALYGAAYLKGHTPPVHVGIGWFFYNLLLASMLLVVLAHNAILFLIAWETMALTSFFLVTFENQKAPVRRAGWIYLIATHLGTAFLLALFAYLGEKAGSFSFDAFAAVGPTLPASVLGVAFVFAVIGFGAKAGFIPFHVWLPEAHPAAPSHVSALMSGAMIKTGLYGLLRILNCLGTPPVWWGWFLLAMGLVSGILGVLFALSQQDLKRLLAYCSVEHIGIITMGLGMGYLGISYGIPVMAVLGFAGALLHVLNHALFKGLLFMGAGSVIHSTGTGCIEPLGGLLKRMPMTGMTFLIGAVGICGLPPLNGFLSEFLLFFGAFNGVMQSPAVVVASLAVIVGLAIIGGLAAVCFAKAFGIVFLGEPRSEQARHAHEVSVIMRGAMLVLAVLCAGIGMSAPFMALLMRFVIPVLVPNEPNVAPLIGWVAIPLSWIVLTSVLLMCLTLCLVLLRRKLLAGRSVGESGTWDCGYVQPTARMQYTASSFVQPVTDFFACALRTRCRHERLASFFPVPVAFSTEVRDLFQHAFYEPFFEQTALILSWFRKAQHGRVQLYVLYIALTLLALLLFAVR